MYDISSQELLEFLDLVKRKQSDGVWVNGRAPKPVDVVESVRFWIQDVLERDDAKMAIDASDHDIPFDNCGWEWRDPHELSSCSCGRMMAIDAKGPCSDCRARVAEEKRWREQMRKDIAMLIGGKKPVKKKAIKKPAAKKKPASRTKKTVKK
jgi:hypothetical protein